MGCKIIIEDTNNWWIGSRIYSQLESAFQAEGADRIRIDVVYEDNVVAFGESKDLFRVKKYS